jgi:catechol 2,3-dioxygenase-like lactoylglutathione lyase family enzyme
MIDPNLDHIVYATPDLAASIDWLAETLGVQAVEGGRHAGVGTRNYLVGLSATFYFELIGPDREQPDPPSARPFGIDDLTAPRVAGWGIHPPDLDAAVTAARTAGYEPGDIRDLSRRTPDGDVLQWRLSGPAPETYDGLVPFFIDWGTTPHPASGLQPALRLVSFHGAHPQSKDVDGALRAVGASLEVGPGAEPVLEAEFEGPNGRVTLR